MGGPVGPSPPLPSFAVVLTRTGNRVRGTRSMEERTAPKVWNLVIDAVMTSGTQS